MPALVVQMVKYLSACIAGDPKVLSLGQEDPLEEGMATHSSILAWRTSEEPGWLPTVHEVAESDMIEQLTHIIMQIKYIAYFKYISSTCGIDYCSFFKLGNFCIGLQNVSQSSQVC